MKDTLEAEIQRHNQEIKQDLMVLRFKTSPKVIKAQIRDVVGPPTLLRGVIHMMNPMENSNVKNQVEAIKEGVSSVASSIKEVVLGASDTLKETVHSATNRLNQTTPVEAVKSGLTTATHAVQEGLSSAGSTLKDTTEKFKEGVSSTVQEVRHQLKDKSHHMQSSVSENPWTSMLIASGAALTVAGIAMALSNLQNKQPRYNMAKEINRFQDEGNPNYSGEGFIESERTHYVPARDQVSGLAHLLHKQPLLVGSTALLIGAAVGALLPRSSYEDRMIGEPSDRLINNVKESVSGTLNEVKLEAKKQIKDLKHVAGETSQEVKQTLLNGLASL